MDEVRREVQDGLAVRKAKANDGVRHVGTASPALPSSCPLTLNLLTGLNFAFGAMAEQIRVSAATG